MGPADCVTLWLEVLRCPHWCMERCWLLWYSLLLLSSRSQQDSRTLALTLIITFISGANFFSVIMFWPTQAFNVYGHDPVGVGVRGLPIGFSILTGAVVVLWLLSVFRGHNRELMIVSSVVMTAGKFPFVPSCLP